MTLGNRIGQYRKKLGLTQEALAQRLDVTNQAVSKWESDQCCPDISLLPRMADIFGITMDELFGREAPVQTMPQPELQPEPEPVFEAEPVFEPESHQEEPRQSWKDSFWGRLFSRTVEDFSHFMKDFEEKPRKDTAGRRDTAREQKLPEDIELPWEDDQTLRVALFVGRKLVSGHPARDKIQFCYEGPAANIYSECSVTCDAVGGNVWAGEDVSCDAVSGSVSAGGDVDCGDVGGNVDAHGDVDSGEIRGDVTAKGDVDCGDVLGHVSAGGDINCGDIQGNLSAGGDVDCGYVAGNVSAGGGINAG